MTNHPESIKKIEEMIVCTDDPRERAFLLISLEMCKSLHETALVTKQLQTDFETHSREEISLILKGRFLWRVIAVSAVLLQGVVVWYLQKHETAEIRMQEQIEEIVIWKEGHKQHHEVEERMKK